MSKLALLGGAKAVTRKEEPSRVSRWLVFTDEIKQAVCEVLDSGDVYGVIAEFEREFLGYHGVQFAAMRMEDFLSALRKGASRIVYSHTADFKWGTGFVSYQSIPGVAVQSLKPLHHCPMGEGIVDHEAFLRACKDVGYDGWIAFEVCVPFHVRHRMPTLKDVDSLVEHGVAYLRDLCTQKLDS